MKFLMKIGATFGKWTFRVQKATSSVFLLQKIKLNLIASKNHRNYFLKYSKIPNFLKKSQSLINKHFNTKIKAFKNKIKEGKTISQYADAWMTKRENNNNKLGRE